MCEYCEELESIREERGFDISISKYTDSSFIEIDLQMQHGAFIRYDSTRLKGNIAIVDDDGEFIYE